MKTVIETERLELRNVVEDGRTTCAGLDHFVWPISRGASR